MIIKVLYVSSRHLTEDVIEEINDYINDKNDAYDSEYSRLSIHKMEDDIWIVVPAIDVDLDDDLMSVLQFARKNGCYCVCISDDGDIIPSLPVVR